MDTLTFSDTDTKHMMLVQEGQIVGVVLTIEQWKSLLDRIENLEDTIAALETELKLGRGDASAIPMAEVIEEFTAEFEAWDSLSSEALENFEASLG